MGGVDAASSEVSGAMEESLVEAAPTIFGISLSGVQRWALFAITTGGIFVAYLAFGLSQEHLIKEHHMTEALFVTFCQFFGYSIDFVPMVWRIARGRRKLSMEWWKYVGMSWVTMGSIALTNWAAQNLNYATVVLFKSSKLGPVMLLNVLLLGRRPNRVELLASLAIVVGLVLFSWGDVKGHNQFTWLGLAAILLSLGIGAWGANLEEKVLQQMHVPNQELVAIMYGCSMVQTLILSMAVEGQFFSGVARLYADPGAIVPLILFSLFGCVGIQFVYLMVRVFGALTTTMVTSVRKGLTICLSFLLFSGKTFTLWHALGAVLMILGMGLNTADKTSGRCSRAMRPSLDWGRKGSHEMGLGGDFPDAAESGGDQ